MQSVPNHEDLRELSKPLAFLTFAGAVDFVPAGFRWDGSSVPAIFLSIFPKHNHPIASCRHDYRCKIAKNKEERFFADKEFEKDIGTTSWWITKKVGYAGVRIGAFFGIGNNF